MIETIILIGGIFIGFCFLILKINKRYERIYGKKNLKYDFDPRSESPSPGNIDAASYFRYDD